jgi:hypothetical protein
LDELSRKLRETQRAQYDALYKKFGKPLVFLQSFRESDHAAARIGSNPWPPAADISQDWLAQADMYEAFFQAASDEPGLGHAHLGLLGHAQLPRGILLPDVLHGAGENR